jgi:hypothetical protein
MTSEYLNSEQNVLITDTVVGVSTSTVYSTKMPYSKFTVEIVPTSGTATIHTSNDNNNWLEWANASVSAASLDICDAVCYIKVTNITSVSTNVSIWGSK